MAHKADPFKHIPSLVEFLHAIHPIPEKAQRYIQLKGNRIKVSRGKLLLKAGEQCSSIYYIHKGVIRSFVKAGGKEMTTWVDLEGEISTSIRGMCYRVPSLENLQTLEDCELTVLSYDDLDYLYAEFNDMNTLGRKFLEASYVSAEERAYLSRIPNARKKYLHLLDTRPEMINRVPLKYIASFLGMTLETLSRIRNSLNAPVKKKELTIVK